MITVSGNADSGYSVTADLNKLAEGQTLDGSIVSDSGRYLFLELVGEPGTSLTLLGNTYTVAADAESVLVVLPIDYATYIAKGTPLEGTLYDAADQTTRTITVSIADVTISGEDSDFTVEVATDLEYTGYPIDVKDNVTVTNMTTGREFDGFSVSPETVQNAGTYDITVSWSNADQSVNRSYDATLTVAKADMGTALKAAGVEEAYAGTAEEVEKAVKADFDLAKADETTGYGTELVKGKDYTLEVSISGTTGTVTATATDACVNYTGSVTATFDVDSTASIEDALVKFDADGNFFDPVEHPDWGKAYYQNGNPVQAKPTVQLDEATLVENVDYTLSWTTVNGNDTAVGNVTKVTITGTGVYKGSVDAYYTIVAGAAEEDIEVQAAGGKEWTGSAIELEEDEVTVTYKGVTVDPKYWSIDANGYSDNIEVSTEDAPATFTVTFSNVSDSDKSPVAAGTIAKGEFQIVARDLKNVTWAEIDDIAYTGNDVAATVKTAIKGTYGEKKETVNPAQYDVAFKNAAGETVDKVVDAGDYTAVVTAKTGAGYGYTGTVELNFTVAAGKLAVSSVSLEDSSVYDGTAKELVVTTNPTGLELDVDYTVAVTKGGQAVDPETGIVDAGSYTVAVTGIGNWSGTVYKVVEVTAKNMDANDDVYAAEGLVYTGSELDPQIRVYDTAEKQLKEGTDYTVTIKDEAGKTVESIVDAGTYTAVVEYAGNYDGRSTVSVVVAAKAITAADVTATAASDLVFNGQDQQDDVLTVEVAGEEVVYTATFWTDATCVDPFEATEVKSAGDYWAVVTIAEDTNVGENYTVPEGGIELEPIAFSVAPFDLADAVVTGVDATYHAGVVPAEDDVTVENADGVDLKSFVTIKVNDSLTNGNVTITPAEDYESDVVNSKVVEYAHVEDNYITPGDVELSDEAHTYNGKAHEIATITVTNDGETLELDKDYTVTYANNVNAGTATVTVAGKGDYAGTAELTFEIAKATLPVLDLAEGEGVYTAAAQEVSASIEFYEAKLVEGTDYELTYTNGEGEEIAASEIVDVDTYRVTAKGIGNFEGKGTAFYEVTPLAFDKSEAVVELDEATSLGKVGELNAYLIDAENGAEPAVVVTLEGVELVQYDAEDADKAYDYTVAYTGNKTAGIATVTVTLNTADPASEVVKNYAAGEKTVQFRAVGANDLTFGDVFVDDAEWTGEAIQPKVQVDDIAGKTLVEGVDYTVSYQNALGLPVDEVVEVGTYTAVVTGIGAYVGTQSVEFDVTDALFQGLAFEDATVAYDGKAHSVAVSGLPEGATVTYVCGDKTSNEPLEFTMVGEYEVTAHVSAPNYTEGHWAESYIDMATAAGLMNGVGEGLFDPDAQIRRADVATILFRATYPNDVSTTDPSQFAQDGTGFADAVSGAYYTSAINWAKAEGIMTGDENLVRPNDTITRAELGAMVARWAASQGVDTSVYDASLVEKCADVEDIPEWAYTSLAWTASEGILGGNADGDKLVMDPQGTATRAQMAKIIVEAAAVVAGA